MLSLTRIFLHNWHRFTDHIIDVEDSLYLAGHNGSGKSSVLDALQVVLIADRRVRFNSSAQERTGQRTLDTYVRGKIGENKWLRPGPTIGYIALEFRNAADQTACTVGVCIEASHDRQAERTFFIVSDALDVGVFINNGRERTRRELRDTIKNRRNGRSFDQVGEYQDQLLARLGGLNPRFFDLFLKALTFQPIRNIREFVEQWLLEEQSLDLDTLRQVKERLADLRRHATETQTKLAALRTIVEQQQGQRRQRHLADTYAVLLALLHEAAATQRVGNLLAMTKSLEQQRREVDIARAGAEAAFNGAQEAYIEANVRLKQLDVVRRRDDLQARIDRLTSEADTMRQHWHTLRTNLRREAQTLQPFVALAPFAPGERAAVDALMDLIADLPADAPPPSTLVAALDAAVPALDAATEQAQQQYFDLKRQLDDVHERRQTLHADLARLLDPKSRPMYPKDVERLRDLLTPVVGERPRLLCELLDVPDERWQDAVEAMLGGRRFNVIVPPHTFAAALRELNRARATEHLYDVGLLDLGKAATEARSPRPNSLASQVQTPSKPIRAYIDTVLGDIITCESVDELRAHRRAVTPDVVVYGEWTARAIPPARYRPWQIGQGARQSQIEALQHEIATRDQTIAERTPERDNWRALVGGLNRKTELLLHRRDLNLPLNDTPLRAEIAEAERELQALDWSGVAALEGEVARLRQIMDGEREEMDRLTGRLAELGATLHARNQEHQTAQRELAERTLHAQETCTRLPHAVSDAEELCKRLAPPDSASIATAEAKAKEFDTKANNALQALISLGTDYNTRYQFAALPANPHEERYAAEEQRLGETDLPRYAEHIAQAEREAEEELREHVLHRLREQIVGARHQLERINDALRDTPFHNERYRFMSEPDNELRPFYDLINDAQGLGTTALHESEFYTRHRADFDTFYDALTRTPRTDEERREQERLTDYRRYLSYDIEVRHRDGTVSRLSKLMGHTSGGETQTPFYVTIAASFVQLYRVGERSGQATTRLVAFDEAFSKMDQDRIGATLDLFQHFKLQIITATPLERCEYLVPKMCTSLVLTGVADQVLIEPYRNYAARLDGFDGA